jgi:preprotein translocase subunit SecA
MGWLQRIFGGKGARRLARYQRRLGAIAALEPSLMAASDEQLRERSEALRSRARGGARLDDLLIEAAALVREAARRAIHLRHFDVQLQGGMALHEGCVAEMKTGEGKTLVATFPAYLNALTGKGVHIVTVNDYLAQRDAEWMGPIYEVLGLTVGVILEDMGDTEAREIRARKAAYACDITYGTNHEIAFDYLRDNLATTPEEIVQRGFHYAIVDEVDFLLIDEARTPLIISGPSREDLGTFKRVDQIVRRLKEGLHYTTETKTQTASLTEEGFADVQKALGVANLADPENLELYHAVHQSVLAHGVYKRDVNYIVDDGEVFIVDEFTGRVSEDKRYADGLHQAIEAKEHVRVKSEDRTLAKVTYQTFFGRYQKLAGMTGTAWTERNEFLQTYGREVVVIPTHKPMIRSDYEAAIFDTLSEKHEAILQEILDLRGKGRAVLVGTTSVAESEQLSRRLRKAGIAHEVLNAKNHRAEAAIIAQAGRKGAVTISTNMAGRGTDILLGGNPEMMAAQAKGRKVDLEALRAQCAAEHEEVVSAGGLHVVGTSHHESPRIDNQLRGRAGRQGDPGSSQFLVSLDDEIWHKFGKAEIAELREELRTKGHPQGAPVEDPSVRRLLRVLQKKVEEENAGIRRDVLKYDLVVNAQRETIYGWRRTLVTGEGYDPEDLVGEVVGELCAQHEDRGSLADALRAHFHVAFDLPAEAGADREEAARRQALDLLRRREEIAGRAELREMGRRILLQTIDDLWTDHLSNLERVEEGIGLRGYAETDPIVAWRNEAGAMWQELMRLIRSRAVTLWFLVEVAPERRKEITVKGQRRTRRVR